MKYIILPVWRFCWRIILTITVLIVFPLVNTVSFLWDGTFYLPWEPEDYYEDEIFEENYIATYPNPLYGIWKIKGYNKYKV